MKVIQNSYHKGGWRDTLVALPEACLILAFGDRELAQKEKFHRDIRENYPNAELIGCTTSGQVCGSHIEDDSLCITVIALSKGHVKVNSIIMEDALFSQQVAELTEPLIEDDLKHILVLSDGNQVNGSSLVKALNNSVPDNVIVSGGLAGDGDRFEETLVWHNDDTASGRILVCGFYGESLFSTCGSNGGWSPFGPKRTVTRSKANVLYELDNKPALDLYIRYLGEHANELPASALLFPLELEEQETHKKLTRTILSINEAEGSMTFAGNIPEGSKVSLMQSNTHRLVEGAEVAAEQAKNNIKVPKDGDGLLIMISCVGRRLVMGDNTLGEVETVEYCLGDDWQYTGFYSYGEIASQNDSQKCDLHNQTMTVTAIYES